jgi:phenylacetate-CoA oxygenase PaaH subunit
VIWEVFRQEREGQPFQHGGSLEAPNLEFAEAYAVEFYSRRAESVALWVVPRDAIRVIEEPYVADVFDRDYRRVDGYSLKVKLREARERAGTS